MKALSRKQKAKKETQIKSLINRTFDYFSPDEILEMLDDQCPDDERDVFIVKCKSIILLCSGEYIASPENIYAERDLKEFCKANDIKLTDYMNNN